MPPTSEEASRQDPPLSPARGSRRATAEFGAARYDEQLESLELRLLFEAVTDRYGYDFRNYSDAFVRPRIRELLASERLATITALMEKLLHDNRAVDRLITALNHDPAPLFDNPAAYAALRQHAVPHLQGNFFVRAWQVGCTTGERPYSLAIVLAEEGLAEKSRIYATDMNGAALRKAKQGLFPLAAVQARRPHYREAGGRGALEDHYSETFDSALINQALRKNVVFAQHNLVTDASFNEFHLITAAGILQRFNGFLQTRVLGLLHDSLAEGGYLLLSPGETPQATSRAREYVPIDESAGL